MVLPKGEHMIKIKRVLENEKGIALITTLVFMMAMGVLCTALVFTVQNEIRTSAAYKYSQQAFFVANAGVQRSVEWYANGYNPDISGGYDETKFPVEFGQSVVMLAGKDGYSSVFPDQNTSSAFYTEFYNKGLQADSDNSGAYALNATLLKHRPTSFLDPNTFEPMPSAIERWRVSSTGFWGSVANPLGIAQITAEIENSGDALFDRALWGIDSVDLIGGSYIDSYDPRLGLWDEFTNSGNMGAIGSNGSVTLDGGADIRGAAAYGPDGTFFAGDNTSISEGVIHLPEPRTFPPIPDFAVGDTDVTAGPQAAPGDIILSPGEYGKITARGAITLQEGTYYVDEFNATSQSTVILEGDVTLYVKSSFSLEGQAIVNEDIPSPNFAIYYSGTDAAKLSGSSSAVYNYYGPNAELSLTGDTDFYGSFIGKAVKGSGGTNIHFDEGNLSKFLIPRPFRLITWSQDVF
jgi:hypothetical protein